MGNTQPDLQPPCLDRWPERTGRWKSSPVWKVSVPSED